ncbi:MAG: radical SAM protein [Sedimentisphaerales bacterium]|nr:radical SAM protein [Sedimentisphaerales bacterium]
MTEIIKPTIIAFEVTRRCVLRCRHCRASATTCEQDVLSTEQCRKILDAIAELKKCVVVLTGGEPMMRQDIFDLTDYGKSLGLRMAIATCGALLDDAAIQRFKRAGLLSFSFSLDGPDAASHDAFRQVPGAFDMTLKAIEKARKADLRFQINTTLTGVNVDHLDAIARLAVDLEASCWNPFVLVPVGRAEQDAQLLLEPGRYEQVLEMLAMMKATYPIELRVTCGPQFARVARQKNIPGAEHIRGCLAASGFAFISYQGDVQTCGFLELPAGNLVQNGYDLVDIWYNSPLLQSIRDLSQYQGFCGQCSYLADCRGCRARALIASGHLLGQDPLCILGQSNRDEVK